VIYKVLYNFKRPNWTSYGRVLFVEAVNAQDAAYQGWQAMREKEPGAEFFDIEIVASTQGAADRQREKEEAHAKWKANAAAGIQNDPRTI